MVENNISESQKDHLIGPRNKLDEAMLEEQTADKSKNKWVKEGDTNTRLYHRVVNGCGRKSLTKELEHKNRVVERNVETIKRAITQFYRSLYTEEKVRRPFKKDCLRRGNKECGVELGNDKTQTYTTFPRLSPKAAWMHSKWK